MDGRGTWLYLCKQHGTWNQSQEPCLALSAGSGSGAGPCWRGPSSVVQPSLLQGTNLAGSVDLCCCIRIRTRTASPCKRRLECVVWAAWRQVRTGALTRTRSEPASPRRGCGLAEEAAPRACCSAVLGAGCEGSEKGQIVYITSDALHCDALRCAVAACCILPSSSTCGRSCVRPKVVFAVDRC